MNRPGFCEKKEPDRGEDNTERKAAVFKKMLIGVISKGEAA